MYRVRQRRKLWRTRWPWRWVFPLKLDERYCRECGFPYHEGPLPAELDRFTVGNLAILVYPAGGFRRNEYVMRVARWRSKGSHHYYSEFIPTTELPDVYSALEEYLKKYARPPYRAAGRS